MKSAISSRREGFTLVEALVSFFLGALCITVVLTVVWTGMRGMSRNTAINLSHYNVVFPLQRLVDDVHSAIAAPSLTGTLSSVSAGSVVPTAFPGSFTKDSTSGKMAGASFATVAASATAAGIKLYVMASSPYSVADVSGTYNANSAGFPVAIGTYPATSTTINIELVTSTDQLLFQNCASNGMRLCIPAAGITSGTTSVMLDKAISSVSVTGSPAISGSSSTSTLVATCTLSGSLGVQVTTNGTRTSSSGVTVFAYLAAPIYYFVCGTDLIRLNYDGNWEVVMRNVVSADNTSAYATPFRLPYPYGYSPIATGTDGWRAVTIRMAASNADYSNNINFRGLYSNMLLYDFTVWSRMQLYDEIAR